MKGELPSCERERLQYTVHFSRYAAEWRWTTPTFANPKSLGLNVTLALVSVVLPLAVL